MATAVSLPLPRRASSSSPVAAARRPGSPSLRRRHCAITPVAAACSPAPPRQLDNEEEGSGPGRRQVLVAGAAAAAAFVSRPNPAAFAAESKKGFLPVVDKKAGYSFLYPFGWQEVAVQGQDKVYKDVIEPLESVSVKSIPTSKEDIRDLGPPDKVAETLIKKVLAPATQKTKLIEAKENDVDGRAYYTFEFTAQAPNYTRHALGAIVIANGKFYTLTTGANERRWEKMKDRLHTVVDSFKIENRI
ncbi:chloroplast oxygen-evolving complex/thylakoid lumenal 25.6kDa protein [Panicum miliaceum]|uniref:Chloroplast oxygen-evolving complex/thylakoid lumenal 25.6kDa protein n=1 Tax=Panicum miliaceum TaxID=4540 RepID=A0A3L6TN26_PANMI|nr:chloroplast oxygen-evolving complex/thylakoid lumenal 25.6kDa protein [Panicum miliaceum]